MPTHRFPAVPRSPHRTRLTAVLAAGLAIPLLTATVAAEETITVSGSGEAASDGTTVIISPTPAADPIFEVQFAPGMGHTVDADQDGLTDDEERRWSLDPYVPDSDYDGLKDGDEFHDRYGYTDPSDPDTDNDGLGDGAEVFTYHTDPWRYDTDGDGYSDLSEVQRGRNPRDPWR